MTNHIKRRDEWYTYHLICTEDVKEHGLEKSCILGNLDKIKPDQESYDDLYKNFPYIKKDKFYKLLEELEKSGLIKVKRKDPQ